MNINKVGSGVSIFDKPEKNQASSLLDAVAPKAAETQDKKEVTPAKAREISTTLREGMYRLSPIDRYRYMSGQQPTASSVNLKVVPGNPEETLSIANQVINQAILPPVFSNPDRQQLPQAIQLKRFAENMIDKAA